MTGRWTARPVRMAGLLAASALMAGVVPAAAADDRGPGRNDVRGQGAARNVILLIGDGMGDSEMTAARYYEYGAEGRLSMDQMPERSAVITSSVDEETGKADYAPDSASTATAWSTGTKTSDGRIGTTIEDQDVVNTMELAKEAGMLVGNVSTARLTDATPAGAMAHVAARGCEGPVQTAAACPQDATENGGPGSIAEQSIDLGVDVLLGGGADRYDQQIAAGRFAGRTVSESAEDRGYTVVRAGKNLEGVQQLPVLGLFAKGHLPTELTGPRAAPGGVEARCEANAAFTDDIPTVDELTTKAIELLDRTRGKNGRANGQPGFFLQVEGASIDKQDHSANPCQQIGETIAFDRAVQVALDYAKAKGNTTVIVSADHSHSSQIISAGDTDSPGATATLTTADGVPMQLNYATSPVAGSQDHTGSTVPFLGFGPGTENVDSLVDQTDLFRIVKTGLGLR